MEHKKTLNLKDSVSIVAGSMIGCGIFIVSSDIARQTNSAILLLCVWLLAGLMTLSGALSYAELASAFSDEGGQYVYLKKIFNKKLAFLYGWTLFLVIQTGTIAAVTVAFAKFLGFVIPFFADGNVLFSIQNWNFTTQQLLAILTVSLITFINSKGIEYGVLTHNIFTATKILSMISIIVIGILFGINFDTIVSNFAPQNNVFDLSIPTLNVVNTAIVGAIFASITWNNITFIAKEIDKPEKNIPKALIIGTLLVISLYLMINTLYLSVLTLPEIQNANSDVVAIALIQKIFANGATSIISIIVAISAFGCANGMILSGARVYREMAEDKLFFSKMALIDKKSKVPVNSLIAQGVWICILILWGSYSQLLDYVIYTALIFYLITTVGIFIYRKKFPQLKPTFKVNDLIPIFFIVTSAYVILCLTIFKAKYCIPGLLITLLGVPMYYIWRWNKYRKLTRKN